MHLHKIEKENSGVEGFSILPQLDFVYMVEQDVYQIYFGWLLWHACLCLHNKPEDTH